MDEWNYRAGHEAFTAGNKASANPYAVVEQLHAHKEIRMTACNAWNAGWMDACFEALGIAMNRPLRDCPILHSNPILDGPPPEPRHVPIVKEVHPGARRRGRAIDVG